mgnify:CR=1 FL=1
MGLRREDLEARVEPRNARPTYGWGGPAAEYLPEQHRPAGQDERDHGDPDQHAFTGMSGLVLGITVTGSTPLGMA